MPPTASPIVDHRTVAVESNRPIARDTYLLRLHWPEAAVAFRPGQFLMLRCPGRTDPLLGRAFALWDTWTDADGAPAGVEIVYEVVGKATGLMARLSPGETLETWGPLGNGFGPPRPARQVILIAGGIGHTPFLALAKQYLNSEADEAADRPAVTLLYGVRSAGYFAGVELFEALGVAVAKATDDGSEGHHGFVTELLTAVLDGQDPQGIHVVACGPEPMLAAAAKITAYFGVGCQVSLETRMACGFGACFSCVAPIRQAEGAWDYKRVCLDGPVFDARDVVF